MKILLYCGLAGAGLIAATAVVAPRMVSAESARAIIAAGVICIVSAWLALVPFGIVSRDPTLMMSAAMAAILIRLGLTLLAGWMYYRYASPPKSPYMNGLVGWYLLLLATETWLIMRLVSRSGNDGENGK